MRGPFTLLLFAAVAVLAGTAVYFYDHHQPAAPSQVSGTPVTYSELAHGANSTVLSRRNYAVHSEPELQQLWQMTDAAGQVPEVDFSAYDVIAVFAGQKTTAGYSISVSSVADTVSERVIGITISSPGGSCVLAEQLTAPYQIIEVPKSSLPLTHADTQVTESCLE